MFLFPDSFYPNTLRAHKYTLILLVSQGSCIQLSPVLCIFFLNTAFLLLPEDFFSFKYGCISATVREV